MSDSFVDTNVLVYAYDHDEPQKRQRAIELLSDLGSAGRLVLSTQVLQEFFVTVTRKLAAPLPVDDALSALEHWCDLPVVESDAELVLAAAKTSAASRLSLWDALIVEAALRARCKRVLSEDMQDGFSLRGVSVENPFVG